MGFKNSFLNVLFNPVGIFQEAGKGISKVVGGGNIPSAPIPSSPLPMPQAPDTAAITDTATKTIQKRKADVTQTLYTSPLGLSGQADIAKKSLLGQ